MNLNEEDGSLTPSENYVCDYCHQKKFNNLNETQYYHFGFKKRTVTVCLQCLREKDDYIAPKFLVSALGPDKPYLEIYEHIRRMSGPESKPVNFYEAVRAAYFRDQATAEFINRRKRIHEVEKDIDKNLRSLWKYTYRIVNGLDMHIKVAKADPDDFLVTLMD